MANVVSKGPCPCGVSSDAFVSYDDGGSWCFRCDNENNTLKKGKVSTPDDDFAEKPKKTFVPIKGHYADLTARGITEETCKKCDYQIGENGGRQARPHPADQGRQRQADRPEDPRQGQELLVARRQQVRRHHRLMVLAGEGQVGHHHRGRAGPHVHQSSLRQQVAHGLAPNGDLSQEGHPGRLREALPLRQHHPVLRQRRARTEGPQGSLRSPAGRQGQDHDAAEEGRQRGPHG
jgi:hypothetical protein